VYFIHTYIYTYIQTTQVVVSKKSQEIVIVLFIDVSLKIIYNIVLQCKLSIFLKDDSLQFEMLNDMNIQNLSENLDKMTIANLTLKA